MRFIRQHMDVCDLMVDGVDGSLMGWREKARELKRETYVLYLAYRDPRTPWHAKVLMAAIIGYALCPLDLIPDFVPVIGFLDDLIIIPAGISLALRTLPTDVIEDCRMRAEAEPPSTKSKWVVALLIILVWLFIAYLVMRVIAKIIT